VEEGKRPRMDQHTDVIAKAVQGSLSIIEQDREKEIISRRFGLNGERETLEQIAHHGNYGKSPTE